MKKLILIGLLIVGLTLPLVASAGVTIYEKGDLKVSVDDLSIFTGYDLDGKNLIYGSYVSFVSYQYINLDAGIVGGQKIDSGIAPMLGISVDAKEAIEKLNGSWKLPQSIIVGFFSSYDMGNEDWMYGPYIGGKITF